MPTESEFLDQVAEISQLKSYIQRIEQYHNEVTFNQSCRMNALEHAPTLKADSNVVNEPLYLTATEIVNEAEIIYNWLIKSNAITK